MMNHMKEMIRFTEESEYKRLVQNGAIVLDVRSKGEFELGHIHGSLHIPLEELPFRLAGLNPSMTYLVCCANGFRSAAAKTQLNLHGYIQVIDAGRWIELNNELQ